MSEMRRQMAYASTVSSVSFEQPAHTPSTRLVSLDVLRGITIAFMILVNNGGEYSYWPLKHSDWNGWTLNKV